MNKADIIRTAHQMAQQGQAAIAIQQLQQVAAAYPADPDLAHHLGLIHLGQGNSDAALPLLERSVALAPAYAEYRSNYATALGMRGRYDEAAQEFRRALAVQPAAFAAQLGLCGALLSLRDYDGAALAARQASAIDPARPEPYVNLGIALTRAGRGREGMQAVEQGLRRLPDHPLVLLHLVANLHYRPEVTPERIRAEHERLGRIMSRALPPSAPFSNTRDPGRPLRVAYLSPDFRDHSVMHFFRPLLAHHDHSQIEVYCYSSTTRPDAITAEVQAGGATWRDIGRTPDPAVEELARGDRIDIAVDLAGHTSGSRVTAMARRIAPIQVSYLGYPNTTGLPAMDYRLVDSLTDPEGSERFATERLIRLDPCFLCYQPPTEAPEVGAPPSTSDVRHPTSDITFGSFNAAQKVVEPVIDAWAAILKAVPGSRLLLKTFAWGSDSARRTCLARFVAAGLDASRVEFRGRTEGTAAHLAVYNEIDIALDTFPYNGTTTTCEALLMGVPVVTLAGQAHAGRVGVSLLTSVGLADLIATSQDEYIQKAVALAQDRPRLATLRSTLRDTLKASPLCDAPAFARRLESAYRSLWRDYCQAAAS